MFDVLWRLHERHLTLLTLKITSCHATRQLERRFVRVLLIECCSADVFPHLIRKTHTK